MRVHKARLGSNPSHSATINPCLQGFFVLKPMQRIHCDTIVVGGGLEGSLLALHWARSGQRVILLDPGRPRDPDSPYDRWVCSPFVYSALHWEWIQRSLDFWRHWRALNFHDGVALAARESTSWARLSQQLEERRLAARPLPDERLGELQLEPSLGAFYFESLPWLNVAGLVEAWWNELQRLGQGPWADTPVMQVDWEHEHPTAVTRDTIVRGKRLVLAGSAATRRHLGQELPELHADHLWLEGSPQLEKPLVEPPAAAWVHYARAPLYLCAGLQRWGLGRLGVYDEDKAELQFLNEARQRWWRCGFAESQVFQVRVDGLRDGLPALDSHPWRSDALWLAGVGQTHWPWLPQLAEALLDPALALPEELKPARLAPAAAAVEALAQRG